MTAIIVTGGGTGGHLMPALALADALRATRPDVTVTLVGAERGIEAALLPHRDYPFALLPAEPLYRHRWWRNLRWPLLLPRLWRRCRQVLDDTGPALVVGTGGYAAGPLLYAAWRRGIPIALQEQNALPGVTTRFAARWARQIHLGFPEAEARLRPGQDTEVHALGNPITPPGATSRAAARAELGIDEATPVVFVMGGSQGSRAINAAMAGVLDAGRLAGAAVLWSAGPRTYRDHATRHDPPRVQVRAFWDPIATAYAAADVIVARAGAMTLAELAAWGLPSVLIPLPTAAADHQTPNAAAFAGAGAAVHLPESELSADRLGAVLTELVGDPARLAAMAAAARARGRPGAAQAIVERLLDLL